MSLPRPPEPDLTEHVALARKFADGLGDFAVNLLLALVILALTVWVSRWASHAVRRALVRFSKTREDRTLQSFGAEAARWSVLIVGLIAVLTRLGVETTSIIAVVGAASLAIGLALQGTLGNVASGVMLLILRPYQVGDYVEIAGRQGTVTALKLFTTEIDTLDNVRIIAPNGKVFGDLITNFTAHGERRLDVQFTVDLEDDIERVMEVMRATASAHPQVLDQPAPLAEITATTDGRATVSLRAWTGRESYGALRSELFVRVRAALAEAGFKPAYPRQRHAE